MIFWLVKLFQIILLNNYQNQNYLRAIFGAKAKGVKDNSYRMPDGEYGRVIETVTFNRKNKMDL